MLAIKGCLKQGNGYFKSGSYSAALQEYNALLASSVFCESCYFNKGLLYSRLGERCLQEQASDLAKELKNYRPSHLQEVTNHNAMRLKKGYYSDQLLSKTAKGLDDRLWAGFSKEVLPLLKRKFYSDEENVLQRADSAWALARWYYFLGKYEKALHYIRGRAQIDASCSGRKGGILLEGLCLCYLGRGSEIKDRLLRKLAKNGKSSADYAMLLSNVYASEERENDSERLALINKVYSGAGISTIRLRNPEQPLSIYNVEGLAVPRAKNGPLVSIVMPIFNAGEQVSIALSSLLRQTWSNLEVIAVDDCSTDNTRAIIKSWCAKDSRVRLIEMQQNSGAYAARNEALKIAQGEFITVHDSDDWSHPDKIALQVEDLLKSPSLKANISFWARAKDNLFFTGTYRANGTFISENTSSLMFRSEILRELGAWDVVRTSADTEFLWRIELLYGSNAINRILTKVPLSFALDQATSLTRTPVTHAKTQLFGPRREYREAAKAWHEIATRSELAMPLDQRLSRPFPIPDVMRRKKRQGRPHYDAIIISDFNLSGGAYISTMHYVDALISLGKNVALFHWRRCDLDVGVPLRTELRYRSFAGDFDILSAGDDVIADLVIVGYPVVLNYRLDLFPKIQTRSFNILVNQMAARLTTGDDPQYCPRKIERNVLAMFGLNARWIPISGYVQQLMQKDERYSNIHEFIWNPLIGGVYPEKPVARAIKKGAVRPVIGRHSRDHYTKWPAKENALRGAYCVNQDVDVRLLGGAEFAIKVLGEKPKNWEVQEFSEDVNKFLDGLDIYVHYPHELYIEEFGRAVLEAMSFGIPVILPPVFKSTFGQYACYSEPELVPDLVRKLFSDQRLYKKMSLSSLTYVSKFATYDVLNGRLAKLTPTMTDVELG